MCIAIAAEKGAGLMPKSLFDNCYRTNSHGLGMAWIDWRAKPNERIKILKNFYDGKQFNLDWFYAAYQSVHKRFADTSPMLLHFRFATHGNKDMFNCHPFMVKPRLCMIHNGVLRMPTDKNRIENLFEPEDIIQQNSDTWHYANLYFSKFKYTSFHLPRLKDHTENFIGKNNKLAFLDANNYGPACNRQGFKNLLIYNEKEGNWDGKIWFSNYGWKSYSYGYSQPSCGQQQQRMGWCYEDEFYNQDGNWRGKHSTQRTDTEFYPKKGSKFAKNTEVWYGYCKMQTCTKRVTNPDHIYCNSCIKKLEEEHARGESGSSRAGSNDACEASTETRTDLKPVGDKNPGGTGGQNGGTAAVESIQGPVGP